MDHHISITAILIASIPVRWWLSSLAETVASDHLNNTAKLVEVFLHKRGADAGSSHSAGNARHWASDAPPDKRRMPLLSETSAQTESRSVE
jgi:hypothetical protein